MAFFKKLEKINFEQAQRLIFISGGAFTHLENDFLDSTSNHYIEKPFSRQDLLAKTRAVVEP